jgi:nitrite reductase (NADH) small subunit
MCAERETWIDVCALEAIPPRGARVVRTPSGCVALFRTIDDAVFALDDRCPHKGGPLSQGIVHGRSVTCPLHGWVISLETGAAEAPDEGVTRIHKARVVEGRVLLMTARAQRRAAPALAD